ncbi:hypothetical protein Cus16_2947 [Curtobacterium sp. ER1/6]|nr:hypothetical protein Cus16_2947 [Curtobacterium sp. ER1/6]
MPRQPRDGGCGEPRRTRREARCRSGPAPRLPSGGRAGCLRALLPPVVEGRRGDATLVLGRAVARLDRLGDLVRHVVPLQVRVDLRVREPEVGLVRLTGQVVEQVRGGCLLVEAGRGTEVLEQLPALRLREPRERREVHAAVAVLREEARHGLGRVVRAHDEEPELPRHRVLGDHPRPRLDVALDEVAQLDARRCRVLHDPVDAVLDVDDDARLGGDELQGELRVVLVRLHPVRHPYGDEAGVVPLGPEGLGGELHEAPGERRVLATADGEDVALRTGGGQVVTEEPDASGDLLLRVDGRLDVEVRGDGGLEFTHATSIARRPHRRPDSPRAPGSRSPGRLVRPASADRRGGVPDRVVVVRPDRARADDPQGLVGTAQPEPLDVRRSDVTVERMGVVVVHVGSSLIRTPLVRRRRAPGSPCPRFSTWATPRRDTPVRGSRSAAVRPARRGSRRRTVRRGRRPPSPRRRRYRRRGRRSSGRPRRGNAGRADASPLRSGASREHRQRGRDEGGGNGVTGLARGEVEVRGARAAHGGHETAFRRSGAHSGSDRAVPLCQTSQTARAS